MGWTGDDSTEWNADLQLRPEWAAPTMFRGMIEGAFRSDSKGPHNLARYFNATTDDPEGARRIINGDPGTVPDWSGGIPVEELIAGYHAAFLAALEAARIEVAEFSDLDQIALELRAAGQALVRAADVLAKLRM